MCRARADRLLRSDSAGHRARGGRPSQSASNAEHFAYRGVPPADQAPGKSGAPFKPEVNEVIVPVTVTDEKGRFVSDLDKKIFKSSKNNKPQNDPLLYPRTQPAGGDRFPAGPEHSQPDSLEELSGGRLTS